MIEVEIVSKEVSGESDNIIIGLTRIFEKISKENKALMEEAIRTYSSSLITFTAFKTIAAERNLAVKTTDENFD